MFRACWDHSLTKPSFGVTNWREQVARICQKMCIFPFEPLFSRKKIEEKLPSHFSESIRVLQRNWTIFSTQCQSIHGVNNRSCRRCKTKHLVTWWQLNSFFLARTWVAAPNWYSFNMYFEAVFGWNSHLRCKFWKGLWYFTSSDTGQVPQVHPPTPASSATAWATPLRHPIKRPT